MHTNFMLTADTVVFSNMINVENSYYDSTSKTQILLQRANFAWRHVVKFAAEIAAI